MKKILFIVLGIISCVITSAQEDTLTVDTVSKNLAKTIPASMKDHSFTKGAADSAYMHSDYVSAIQHYENLLKEKGESADIYYNLGNSYYKAENIAKAILNYERALLLKPGDNDIRFNLEMARNKTVDKVEPVNEIFFVTWIKSLMSLTGADSWGKIAIATFFLFILALALFIFGKQIGLKKIGFTSAIIFFIAVLITNLFAYQQKEALNNRTNAIVIAPSVTAKSTPNEGGTDLFILHEGHKVSIKDGSMKEWKEIRLEDGNVGWVPTTAIEII